MPAFPLEVEVNEETLIRELTIFKEAQKQIIAELEGATNFGMANRRAIIKQVNQIIADLAVETGELVAFRIPKQYKRGANDAVKQLNKIGAEVNVSTGFSVVHEQAIRALVDDTAKAFGESMSGMIRNARRLLGLAVREEITQKLATGKIQGSALRNIKHQVIGVMREEGFASLIDKGGRKWELDRYSEMLIRTKSVEARNKGLMNRIVENGYDLVQVSNHGTTHAACAKWEGEILSSTGQTKGYPTLADAESEGLFHPNCKHAVNAVVPDLARETEAYDFKTGKRA